MINKKKLSIIFSLFFILPFALFILNGYLANYLQWNKEHVNIVNPFLLWISIIGLFITSFFNYKFRINNPVLYIFSAVLSIFLIALIFIIKAFSHFGF